MVRPQDRVEVEHIGAGQHSTTRPVVRGTQGIVSAGHYLTSMSAVRMLLAGGNAFDAAAAAGLAAAVVEPTAGYSLASEAAIMLYHAASGQVRTLSGQGVAPGKATVEYFKGKGMDKIPTGPGPNAPMAFTIPGVVHSLLSMLETYGTRTAAEVMAPAIEYAERGFPMWEIMRRSLGSGPIAEQFAHFPPGATEVFHRGGQPIPIGQLVVQKQLGATLRTMVQAELEAGGNRVAGVRAARDAFYRGSIARAIVANSQQVGGLVSLEDLEAYSAPYEDPVTTSFMGYQVHAQSTWTQGAVLLQALNMLEHFDLPSMGHNSPQYVHTLTEALKLALADREAYYGDPRFATVPIQGLVSKEYAASRAALIRADQASPGLPDPGDPWKYQSGAGAPATIPSGAGASVVAVGGGSPEDRPGSTRGRAPEEGTTHFAIMDRDGNVVAATPSGGTFTKSVFFPDLGFAISTRSEMFFLDEAHPNGLQPGKRPRTTLVNYLVSKDGQPVMTAGCPGGDAQAQANLQLILNVLVFGMDPQQAVEAPRFATASVTNSFYPRVYLPGQLNVEPTLPEDVLSHLASMGHKVTEVETCGVGAVVATRDPDTGTMAAGADPRRPTYAIGW